MRTLGLTSILALALSAASAPASAAIYAYYANLDGASEAPPHATPGYGKARVVFDDLAHTMEVDVTFAHLLAGNTAAHIHAATTTPFVGTAPVATTTPTFTGFPNGATSGSYSHLFDMTLMSSYRSGFINDHGGTTAGAEAALIQAAMDGKSYLNVHTTVFPGGEIRGFLTPAPEPASWALMLAGFGLTGAAMRARRRTARGVARG